MLGRVSAKINIINEMIQFYGQDNPVPDAPYSTLNDTSYQKENQAKDELAKYLKAQLKCMYQSVTHPDEDKPEECTTYETESQNLLEKLSDEAKAIANRDDYLLNPRNTQDYLRYLNSQKNELSVQQDKLYAMLGEMNPLMGGILGADQLAIANLSDTYKDDNWLQFSFDSSSSYERTDQSSSHEFTSASGGVHILFFHIGASYTHSKDTSHYEQKLAQSNMKAKGKLLRVNIKRPWFRPETFEDPNLNFVSAL